MSFMRKKQDFSLGNANDLSCMVSNDDGIMLNKMIYTEHDST